MRISSRLCSALTALLVAVPVAACTDFSGSEGSIEIANETDQCTFTQGYWKNHPEAWPVDSLMLGSVTYTKDELLEIFDTPVAGNGLIALAHQLIAAKLNIAFGAPDASIDDEVEAADDLIGGLVIPPIGGGYLHPSVTSALTAALDGFNNSRLSGEECVPEPYCGDGNVDAGEECDDGNNDNGDGCSATCEVEPYCGDGYKDPGEECDDGDNVNGDGCSATCEVEHHEEPCCGDGYVDPGEECDDGNLADGDGCSAVCTVEPPVCEPEYELELN